jgi:hypothetical protein
LPPFGPDNTAYGAASLTPVILTEWVAIKQDGKYRGEVYLELTWYPRESPNVSHFAVYYAAAIGTMPTDPGSISIATTLAYSDTPHVSIRRLAFLVLPRTRAGSRIHGPPPPTDLLESTLSLEIAQRTSTLPARLALHGHRSLRRKTRRIPAYTPSGYHYPERQRGVRQSHPRPCTPQLFRRQLPARTRSRCDYLRKWISEGTSTLARHRVRLPRRNQLLL